MKRKIIISVVALMLFAFSIAAFAYTNQTIKNQHSCCGKDSCPMKKDGKNSSCDKADCCQNGDCKDKDSCPMKSKENKGEMKECPMKDKANKDKPQTN